MPRETERGSRAHRPGETWRVRRRALLTPAPAALLALLMLAAFIPGAGGPDGPPGAENTPTDTGRQPAGHSGGTRAWDHAFNNSDTDRASATGIMELDCDLQFLQGTGGGQMDLTITGGLASLLRHRLDDPWYRYGGNMDGLVTLGDIDSQNSEGGSFAEAFEDRLEGTSNIFIDIEPPTFNSRLKGMDLRRDEGGGVDVRSMEGLDEVAVDAETPVKVHFDIKGSITGADREILLSDGYVLVYALFGEEFNVTVKEELSITAMGFTSLEPSGGTEGFSRERVLGGQVIHYDHEYMTGSAKPGGDESFSVDYTGFSPVYSPPLLFAYLVVVGVVIALTHRWARNRSAQPRNLPFLLVVLFLLGFLLQQYLAGLAAPVYLAALILSGVFLTAATRLLYPPSPELTGDLAFRPMATGSLVGPGHTGGMSTLTLKGRAEAPGGPSVEGWVMVHRTAHECYEKGDLMKTMELLEAGLALEPENHMLLNDKGFILLCMGRHEEALEHFKRSLKAEPDYTVARANITKCLIEKDL